MTERRLAALLAAIVATTIACDDCDENEVESRWSRDIEVGPDGRVILFNDAGTSDAGTSGSVVTVSDCKAACEQSIHDRCGRTEVESCSVVRSSPESATVRCKLAYYPACLEPGTMCGRRPEGAEFGRSDGAPLAALFGGMAALEAASVPAFRRLRRELEAAGAPRRLVRAALRSARDEVAHARMTRRLARRFNGSVAPHTLGNASTRALVDLAIENAIEGCVRETFGALVATYQAQTARDVEIRSAMRRIARDETRHAALARKIDRFLEHRLTRAERTRVRDAKRGALATLAREVGAPVDSELVNAAGVPTPSVARSLLERAAHILAA